MGLSFTILKMTKSSFFERYVDFGNIVQKEFGIKSHKLSFQK